MRLLDLFCGAGGAGMGYRRAGFEVVGVDIAPQPHYPFAVIRSDVFDLLGSRWLDLSAFDAIHASPPCQHFTKYSNTVKDIRERYEDLLAPTRELLKASGLPYVIENVERSPLISPVRLCGSMFDGKAGGTHDIQRHRLFETNWRVDAPSPCDHSIWAPNRYTGGRSIERGDARVLCRKTIEVGKWGIPLTTQKWAMGVDWDMTGRELSEAVPPAYTEYIGTQLLAHLRQEAAA